MPVPIFFGSLRYKPEASCDAAPHTASQRYPKPFQIHIFIRLMYCIFVYAAVCKNCLFTSDIAVDTSYQHLIDSDFAAERKRNSQHYLGVTLSPFARPYGITDMSCVFFEIVVETVPNLNHSDQFVIAFAKKKKLCGGNSASGHLQGILVFRTNPYIFFRVRGSAQRTCSAHGVACIKKFLPVFNNLTCIFASWAYQKEFFHN